MDLAAYWEKIKTKAQEFKKELIVLSGFALLAVALLSHPAASQTFQNSFPTSGASGDSRAQWQVFDKFEGYQTKADPQKITVGGNPVGQNTYINDGDRISIRDFGYEMFPSIDTESSTGTPITSLYTFRKRDGTNIILRTYSDRLEYYADKIGDWELLKNGFTPNQTFGFADHNTNIDQTSYVYFGNGVENYQRWSGNVAKLTVEAQIGTTTLNIDSTSLFSTTGTLEYCGTSTTYTLVTSTSPFSFSVPSTTVDCLAGRGVAQVPQEFANAPKGNILMVQNTRMFVAGVTSSTQTLFYSKIADASDFTFSATRLAGDGGVINMPEGGGGIVGLIQDQGVLYAFKRNIVKSVTFSNDGNDLPTILPIKPFDNRSETVGAISGHSLFAGANGTFFITPNNEILLLSQIPNIIYPQVENISDVIKPTVDGMDFSSSTGIFWKNKAYFFAKQTPSSIQNDTILVYNTVKKAWESPIVGINISDVTIASFATNVQSMYLASAFGPNVYLANTFPLDNGNALTANWRSREETFGAAHVLKSIDNFYVEGYISDNTQLSITLLYDENGYTQTQTTVITGNENNNQFLFNKTAFNIFGLNPFGFERFGSNQDVAPKKKFRVYLAGNIKRVPFYSVQVEFASTASAAQWEILQYAYHWMPETQEMRSSLIRSW